MRNDHPNRKRNRLKEYDYSNGGYYFVTICIKDRKNWFGEINNKNIILNNYGKTINDCWTDLVNHYRNCQVDEYIIMPNHFHGIVIIDNDISDKRIDGNTKIKLHGLSEIIRGFKTFSSRKINELSKAEKFNWQRSIYDQIIRNEKELYNIRRCIVQNPLKWELEKNIPENIEMGGEGP